MLWPTNHKKPTGDTPTSEEWKKTKKVWQAQAAQQRALEREEGMEVPLYERNPSMLLDAPVQWKAMERAQMHRTNPGVIEATTIDDLCTQLEGLTLNEREEGMQKASISP